MNSLKNVVAPLSRKFPPGGIFAAVALAALVVPDSAFAAAAGAGLPWEGPLETLTASLSGPVAYSVSLLGMVGCGVGLVFGGEMSDFLRRGIMLVMAVCFLAFAAPIMQSVFGVGALL